MNEQLKKFLNDVGVLCETWMVIYQSFLKQGLSPAEALKHTQALNAAMFTGIMGSQGKSEN